VRFLTRKQLAIFLLVCGAAGAGGYVVGLAIGVPVLFGFTTAVLTASAIVSYLRLERRYREKVREAEIAQRELTLARELQQRLLPPATVEGEGFRVAARNVPAQIVAGDFYDVFMRPDGALVIFVADVAGKGIASSLIMASVKSILPLITTSSVTGTMSALNERLVRELQKREFVALLHAVYAPSTGLLEFSNGGLPDPYLVRGGKATPQFLGGQRLPLGMKPSIVYGSRSVQLEPGDRVLFFTDGVPESLRHDGEPFGYEAFSNLVESERAAATPAEALDSLIAALDATTRVPRDDDWTMVMLERLTVKESATVSDQEKPHEFRTQYAE
jgi:sigma-B regulation protein RsbU (phosphoserine phosphatase)